MDEMDERKSDVKYVLVNACCYGNDGWESRHDDLLLEAVQQTGGVLLRLKRPDSMDFDFIGLCSDEDLIKFKLVLSDQLYIEPTDIKQQADYEWDDWLKLTESFNFYVI